MTTGPNTGKNRKKVLIVGRMPQAGIDTLKTRDDVDYEILTDDTVPSLQVSCTPRRKFWSSTPSEYIE